MNLNFVADFYTNVVLKEFGEMFNSRQRRQEMGVNLKNSYDQVKPVLRLDRALSVPGRPETVLVPVLVNLLPKYASASVTGYECPENSSIGLIMLTVNPSKHEDKAVKCFVLFHLEDVVDEGGNVAFHNPSVSVQSLKNVQVDLVARSIAAGDNYSDITKFIAKLSSDYPEAQIPVLQAVTVFLKSSDGRILPGCAPLPTFLRKEPRSFNFKQPATAFHLGLGLKNALDMKVLEWMDTCPSMVKSALASILNPWFTAPNSRTVIKKEIPRGLPEILARVDKFGNSKHKLGSFDPVAITPPIRPPATLTEVKAKVVLIHLTSQPKPRMGVLQFDLAVRGSWEKCHAYFTLKTVIMDQRSFGDVTNLVSVAAGEELVFNGFLMSENSKIPYIATAVWKARDGRPQKEGLDLTSLTEQQKDEWRKNTDGIVAKWSTVYEAKHQKERQAEQEAVMRRAQEALSRAGGEQERTRDDFGNPLVRKDDPMARSQEETKMAPEEEEKQDEPHIWKWETTLTEWVGTVEKVINNNFALGVSYQRCGWEERRFFVLYDTTDVWVDGEVAHKKGKGMKEIANRMDGVKFNAVLVDGTENSWNLIYLATAVIMHKDHEVLRSLPMPPKAIKKSSSADLNPAKVKTFEQVAGKLTQKPAPEDPNELARREEQKRRMEAQDRARREKKERVEQAKARHKADMEREDRAAQIAAIEEEKKAEVRRRELMSNPELWTELQSMEYKLDTQTLYSCKLCGIQAMTLADAESHIFEDEHKKLRAERLQESTAHMSREEAEEALFLNQNKEIKDEVIKIRGVMTKVYTCEKCNANKLPMKVILKHISSTTHKKNFRDTEDAAMLEQECKEMKKKGRRTTTYFCTPCGFTSDSIISTKHHLIEAAHKKRTMNYCHACKSFSTNRGKHQEHRFSIAHKRTMEELDKPYKEEVKKVDEEAKDKKKRAREQEEEEEEKDAEPEDPLICRYCEFTAEDEDQMKEHRSTEAHRRRQYLITGRMPPVGEEDALVPKDKEFTNLEHMQLVHRCKELSDKANKAKNMMIDEELKRARKEVVEFLYKESIFEKMEDSETAIKCSSCEVRLQGHAQEKKRIQQLFIHFIGDKHVMRLRVAVKGEEIGANVVEEVVEETSLEEKPEEQEEEELVKLPDPLVFSQHHWLTEYEGEVLLVAMAVPAIDEEDETYEEKQAKILLKGVSSPAPKLHQCSSCATGLMTAKFMLRHFDSDSHKNREEPPRWRTECDMSSVYEHGPSLFFCLVSNAGFFDPDQLAIHQSTKAYKKLKGDKCADEQAKEALFSRNIPHGAPRCDNCNRYFANEAEMSRHMLTKMHSIRTDQLHDFDIGTFTDNDDLEARLAALPEAKVASSSLPSKLESQRGRIAMIFESSAFVLVHFKLEDTDAFAVFDRSRVVEKGRDVR